MTSRSLRDGVRLALIAGAAKAPGFVVPLLLASVFGAGQATDGFFLAYAAALLVAGAFGQAVESAIVPCAASAFKRQGDDALAWVDGCARWAALRASVLSLLAGAVLLAGIELSASPAALRARALPPFGALMILAVAWCAASAYAGSLVAIWKLEVAAIGSIWRGVGGGLGILVAWATQSVVPVAVGLTLGECARVWWLRARLARFLGSARPAPVTPACDQDFVRAARQQSVAQGVLAMSPFLERIVAASLAVGVLSHLEYASRLLVLPALLIEGGFAPILLARWSGRVSDRGRLTSDDVTRPLGLMLCLIAALSIVVWALAPLGVRALLQRSAFSAADTAVVAMLLRLLALGFGFSMFALLVERAFLAERRNRLLGTLAIVRVSVRLLVLVTFVRSMGIVAFPLAFVVAEGTNVVGLLFAWTHRSAGIPDVVAARASGG